MLTDEDIENARAALAKPVPRIVKWFWDVESEPLNACARFWKRDHALEYAAMLSERRRRTALLIPEAKRFAPDAYRAVRYTIT